MTTKTHNRILAEQDRGSGIYFMSSLPLSCGVALMANLTADKDRLIRSALYPEHRHVCINYANVGYPMNAFNRRYAQVIFSDAVDRGHGEALARRIKELDLGPVFVSDPAFNSNSGNQIKTWIWNVPQGELTKAQREALGFKDI